MPKHPGQNARGHKARKRFGQNFLTDQNIIHQIVRCINPQADDALVEIGPGQGALTGPLLQANPRLEVIELDRDLIPILLAQFANYKDFKIHQCDVLAFDFASISERIAKKAHGLRIIGNLPYNISTPLIFKLLDVRHHIQDMHFMLQKEVVERLTASPGDKNYGRLSIMSQYYCQVDHRIDVPPQSFNPAPKVNSAVVTLRPYQALPFTAENMANFERLVKAAFQQRRKTLRNCLKSIIDDQQAERVGLDLSLRAENVPIADYVRYCNALWGKEDITTNREK